MKKLEKMQLTAIVIGAAILLLTVFVSLWCLVAAILGISFLMVVIYTVENDFFENQESKG